MGEGALKYERLEAPRFAVQTDASGADLFVIKARRNWFAMVFLSVWLTMWTFGGGVAIAGLFIHFVPFLLLWLVGWAFGWVFASGSLAWMLVGAETLRIVGGDLEVGWRIGPVWRRKLYQGAQVRRLRAASPASPFFASGGWSAPFMGRQYRSGALRFDYGARTLYAAAGLDEAEGAMLAERLARRLPPSATAALAGP